MAYRYDLHVHTCEGSACARSVGADMADFYKSKGYSGFVVTDHCWSGNTRVDRSLPWKDWLSEFHKGYEHAKERGEEIGLSVFYGWEYSFHGNDFITLGLDNDWLLEHPEVTKLDLVDYLNLVREAGAYVIHAHPFFEARYIPYIRLLPRDVDAVEVVNAPKGEFVNGLALHYARAYDLIETGGSDCHSVGASRLSGIELDEPAGTLEELIGAMRRREHRVIPPEAAENN